MSGFPRVGDTFGGYVIESLLGHGGMGVVFRARNVALNRPVALKVLSPVHAEVDEFRERFVREAALLAAVDSPHIIQIYEHGEQDGCLFIATQLVPGGDLADRLRQQGPLTLEQAIDLTGQVASALSDAHAAGVIHRDVKPNNILLRDDDGRLHGYLCDFGIARGDDTGLTQTGAVIGTFGYLAPERCLGQDASPASDVYSLGCVLVAALTGAPPYAGTDLEMMQHHVHSAVPQWEETDEVLRALNQIVRRAMAKGPADRYQSARDMRHDLLHAQSLRSRSISPEASGLADYTIKRPPLDSTIVRAPAPVSGPGSGPGTVPLEPAARSGTARLLTVAGAATVIMTLMAVITYLVLQDHPDAVRASSPSSAGSKRPASAPASAPPSGSSLATQTPSSLPATCWDGSAAPTLKRCPDLTGVQAMAWTFPSFVPSKCHPAVLYDGKLTSYRCNLRTSSGRPGRLVYSEYQTAQQVSAHYGDKYGAGVRQGDLIRYGPDLISKNSFQSSLVFADGRRWAVTAVATNVSDVLEAIQLVRTRSIAEMNAAIGPPPAH